NSSTTSATATVTLANVGKAPLILSSSRLPCFVDPATFPNGSCETAPTNLTIGNALQGNQTCTTGLTLSPNSSCDVTVTATGDGNAYLVFADNSYSTTPDPQHVGQVSGFLHSVSISSTFTPPSATIGPEALVFTAVNATQQVTVSNSGSVALTVSGISLP